MSIVADISIQRVWFDATHIYVELNDGRIIGNPLSWFPRLKNASLEQLEKFELIANGDGVHWAELDEDLSAEGFLTFKGRV